MPAIGDVWVANTWDVDAWAANTWDAAVEGADFTAQDTLSVETAVRTLLVQPVTRTIIAE